MTSTKKTTQLKKTSLPSSESSEKPKERSKEIGWVGNGKRAFRVLRKYEKGKKYKGKEVYKLCGQFGTVFKASVEVGKKYGYKELKHRPKYAAEGHYTVKEKPKKKVVEIKEGASAPSSFNHLPLVP